VSEIQGILQDEGEKILANIADVELDPTLLEQLYTSSPLRMTKAQRAVVVESLRRRRAALKVKQAAKKAKAAGPSQPSETITLDDLDIEL
jgi:hypothetical protein